MLQQDDPKESMFNKDTATLNTYGLLCLVIIGIFVYSSCRDPYNPPAIQSPPAYLVVDGYLNAGPDSTVITLSRTRNLDSTSTIPELHALVTVIGDDSVTHTLYEQGNGVYVSPQLGLNSAEKYRLRIMTANGEKYQSDTIPVRQAPPIDSISWRNDSAGVSIYVSTHDPLNSTWYYKWDYTETWQYQSGVRCDYDWVNDEIVSRTDQTQIYNCWTSLNSTDIHVATSSNLSSDIINNLLLTSIPMGSEKLSMEYSILVRQYAITSDAYNYWQNLKLNTEQMGGLFDPQPSQLTGNIHCITNPQEPVMGYIGASTVANYRIFILAPQVTQPWGYVPYYAELVSGLECTLQLYSYDQMVQYFDVPAGSRRYVLYGTPTGAPGYLVVFIGCADCRIHGGTNIKPSFWPN
ncbi:MAG TPA: DUF4249 domain-containing protein [Puia sp.]|nr:DUF4249 domain-containing protein [Puia sp.]